MNMIRLDPAAQIETINNIVTNYLRDQFGPPAVPKIGELLNLIEDITLTEDEREKRQEART